MKIKIVLLTTAIASFLAIFSCTDSETLDSPEVQTKDQIVVNNIMKFLDDIQEVRLHPETKSSDAISIDSAVWYIEAAINYTSTNPISSKDSKFNKKAYSQNVPVNNGEISYADIQNVYDTFLDSIETIQDVNEIYIADIFIDGNNGSSVKMNLALGITTSSTKSSITRPTTYDWYWGLELGRCDGSGLGVGNDAATVINSYLNQAIIVPPAGAFWTDVETVNLLGYQDGLFEFMIDAGLFTEHPCINNPDILDYIDIVETVTNNNQPTNKELSNRHYYADPLSSIDYYGGRHCCDISYAKMVYGINP